MKGQYPSMKAFIKAAKEHSDTFEKGTSGHGYVTASLMFRKSTSPGYAFFRVTEWLENGQGKEYSSGMFQVKVKVK